MSNFNPNTNHQISLATAASYTKAFRATVPVDPQGQYLEPIALAYGKTDMLALLNQTGCEGFRVYFGIDENGNKQLVFTAVDINGDDMYNGILVDEGLTCPKICGKPNPLNA